MVQEPEAIKVLPVVKEFENREDTNSIVCVTSQHCEMLDQILKEFDIKPDIVLVHGDTTERLEGIEAKTLKLVGTD